jgi:hypothetical protein
MKKKNVFKLLASATLAIAASGPIAAQNDLGASCGCPLVSARPDVIVSSMSGYVAVSGTYGGELTTGATFTCANNYILDKKIYIPNGQTLTIAPGTVIKGAPNTVAAEATALIIERGGKILAQGTESCPIVFTAQADPMDGTYAFSNIGKWGGVVLLGKATNNLSASENGPFQPGGTSQLLAAGTGLGVIEGFATSNPQDRYGVLQSGTVAGETVGSFDDNDNSGVLRYVSIRHSGAILAIGAEINGLTLGSVGRGTTIEHIEIVSCADDNIELFGGTVNLKYITTLFGNDDMFDFDLGWSGKAQFLFGMKSNTTSSPDSDNGFEADSDDQKSYNTPLSNPTIYNVTLIGNSKLLGTSDNSALAAINAKEFAGGTIANSIFANFRNGMNLVKTVANVGVTAGARSLAEGGDSWHNWTNNPSSPATATATTGNGSTRLKVKCNTFVNVTYPLTTGAVSVSSGGTAGTSITSGDDFTQFTSTDLNSIVSTLAGFDWNYTTSGNTFSVKNDVVPNPAVSTAGCPSVPVDGFFENVAFRGAFTSVPGENWLSNWTYSALLGTTKGLGACPTDINKDGVTNVSDFLDLSSEFGNSCID